MDNRFDEIAAKLKSAGMDDDSIAASREALLDEFADVPEDELDRKIEEMGGVDGITESVLEKYETAKKNAGISDAEVIDIDEDMFSDGEERPEGDADETAAPELSADDIAVPENEDDEERISSAVAKIDEADEPSTSKADEYFNDDEDVKVEPPVKNKAEKKPQQPVKKSQNGKTPAKKKKISVKNMSQRAKTVYIIGLIFLIPILIALVVAITVIFLALYAAIIALVIAFSVALVIIAAVGTALSLMAVIFGVIQIVQGAAAPIGIYEIGLGVVAGGITLGVSILLYNFIVRLAPFLFKKMFVLYKFLFRQLTKLLSFVKGACSKL